MDKPLNKASFRVKVYQLSDGHEWVDKGTGSAKIENITKLNTDGIIVNSEEDESVILEKKIFGADIYQQQQETLIVWNDPETDENLALSFVDKHKCLEFWKILCKIQKKIEGETESELPTPNIANLPEIERLINQTTERESLGMKIYNDLNFLEALLDMGDSLENVQPYSETLYSIFKGIILLNDLNVLDLLFSDENILRLMNILQHDPKIPITKRINHRDYLTKVSVFKEVVPIKDEEIISKIHQTFRIKYLRDSVLLSELDDVTLSSLNTLVFYNNIEIISLLQNDHHFLTDLFNMLLNESSETKRVDLISFLQQFFELLKNLQDDTRFRSFRALQSLGLFSVFEKYLETQNRQIILPCLDVLNITVLSMPNEMRAFLSSTPSCLAAIIHRMLDFDDCGVTGQICEILRFLLDNDYGDESEIIEKFLSVFYSSFLEEMLSPFFWTPSSPSPSLSSPPSSSSSITENNDDKNGENVNIKNANNNTTTTTNRGDDNINNGNNDHTTTEKNGDCDQNVTSTSNHKEKGNGNKNEQQNSANDDSGNENGDDSSNSNSNSNGNGDGDEDEDEDEEEGDGDDNGNGNNTIEAQSTNAVKDDRVIYGNFSNQKHYQNVVYHVCDLLSFCVSKHGKRIRNYLIKTDVIQKSLHFLSQPDGFLSLCIVRLVRMIVGRKNRNFDRKIVQCNVFKPIMELFRSNSDRNNMTNSTILELFSFIDIECFNNVYLISFLVKSFREDFEKYSTTYPVFKNLMVKYDDQSSDFPKKRKRDELEENVRPSSSLYEGEEEVIGPCPPSEYTEENQY